MMDGRTAGRAYRARMRRAVGEDGDRLMADLVQRALDRIGPDPTPHRLRELGGITAVCERELGEAPDAEADDLGMATSTEWWRWRYLHDQLGKARLDVQWALARPRIERIDAERFGAAPDKPVYLGDDAYLLSTDECGLLAACINAAPGGQRAMAMGHPDSLRFFGLDLAIEATEAKADPERPVGEWAEHLAGRLRAMRAAR